MRDKRSSLFRLRRLVNFCFKKPCINFIIYVHCNQYEESRAVQCSCR